MPYNSKFSAKLHFVSSEALVACVRCGWASAILIHGVLVVVVESGMEAMVGCWHSCTSTIVVDCVMSNIEQCDGSYCSGNCRIAICIAFSVLDTCIELQVRGRC